MSEYSFKLPDLGEGIVVSEIVEWHVAIGDQVIQDQHIVDVMTDKAVVEVTSPVSGSVQKLACQAGIEIAVGSELILFSTDQHIENSVSDVTATAQETNQKTSSQSTIASQEKPEPSKTELVTHSPPAAINKQVLSSPSVRKRAREQNIDLTLVSGSGHGGRINNCDLDIFIANGAAQVNQAAQPQSLEATVASHPKQIKISGLRKVIAQRMLQSKRNIPHYSYIEEIDLTALEALRKHLNSQRDESQSKLTILPFVMQALIKVSKQFPHCNAHYDEENERLTQYDELHLGIATMTDQGLLVPVVKHVQTLDIWQSAQQLTTLTKLARAGKASAAELTGSTLTITSLGAIGGIATTPIINAPQTCIVGINKMQQRPVVINGQITIRTMMNLSASFDHRIVDGYDGALMIQALKALLENPGAIFV